jgi:hypothetical protein
MTVRSCMVALLQVRAQIERAQALAAKLSDQTTVSGGLTERQGFSYNAWFLHCLLPRASSASKARGTRGLQAHQCKQLQ